MSSGAGARAIVLGGGVAGLAAAFGLADRGLQVVLIEAHGWLGGRAFSFTDRRTGRRLDNGPHVMLGCYRAMRGLLDRLGTGDEFADSRALQLSYRTVGGGSARLRLPRLPVPLALPLALLRMPWPVGERGRALRGLLAVVRGAPADWTVADWLRRRAQQGAPAAWLWQPLCRAIMNVGPESGSARLFLATLREAFGGGAAAAAIWIPKRPWSELIGEPALQRLRAAGIEVRLATRVTALQPRGDAIGRLEFGDGGSMAVDPRTLVVSALPWHALARLLPSAPFAALAASPLVSIYFDVADVAQAPPDEGELTALVDGEPFHFLCRTPAASRQQFALLAGGNRALDRLPVAAIEQLARAQLARHYPGFDVAAAANVRVAKEARATFVADASAQALRPAPGRLPAGPSNLRVCGDWTDCGLPATLEGAARSAALMLRECD